MTQEVVVETVDGQAFTFDCAGYSTDEHNNLCIESEHRGVLLAVFAKGQWLCVRIEDGDYDGDTEIEDSIEVPEGALL